MYKRVISLMIIGTVLSGVGMSMPAYALEEYELGSRYSDISF